MSNLSRMVQGIKNYFKSLQGKMMLTFIALSIFVLAVLLPFFNVLEYTYEKALYMQSEAVETGWLLLNIKEMLEHVRAGTVFRIEDRLDKYRQMMDNQLTVLHVYWERQDAYYFTYRDLYYMHQYFDSIANRIINEYRIGNSALLRSQIPELERAKDFISDKFVNLMEQQIQQGLAQLQDTQKSLDIAKRSMVIWIIVLSIVDMFCAVLISRWLTRSIKELVLFTDGLRQGFFNQFVPKSNPPNEIANLIDAYNQLTTSVKSLLEKNSENARLESQLKEQTIINLELQSVVKETELNFLRSQINPHFLFNSLNAAMSMADIENAQNAKKILSHIAFILRYALNRTDRFVLLQDEIALAMNYLEIQQIRFGDRMHFEIKMDPSASSIHVPPMILQPFIENSMIHGIEPCERPGMLGVYVYNFDCDLLIRICDNGNGMSPQKLQVLHGYCNGDVAHEHHGVYNVIKRLRIVYGCNVVSIDSREGSGTDVCLLLPKS